VKKYRVWTLNFGGSVTIMTDWMTRNDCKRFVLGRWGHFPPFAIISTIKLIEKFARRYCP
jgi:hypothetical protein